jgi:ankyrin repeat protein
VTLLWRVQVLLGASAALIFAAGTDTRLADAAQQQDRAAVRALLAKHVDSNSAQVDGTTALAWAARNDDLETAKILIAAGADLNFANRYGVLPLSLACTNGSAAMIRLLLEHGANPKSALPGGETALMTAARTGNPEAVNALIAAGADVNAKESKRGQTALMWAAAEGNVATIEALIKAGADLHARLDSGFTPFLFAVREGRLDAVKALRKAGADVNETIASPRRITGGKGPRAGTTPLILAAINAHYELAAWLLDAGADPNATGPGYTALHTVTWIRKSGVGDNDPSPDGSGNMTSMQFVKKLIERGADVNARMTKKVNVGLTSLNTLGATTFLLAARTGDAELMRYLATLGADPKIPNADGANAVIVAAGLGTRSPGEDAGTESEVVEALQAALDLGCDINAVDNNGESAMHGAAYKNLPRAVDFLAAHGAKVNVWNQKNKQGWTPLTIAEGYRFGNFKPSPETAAAIRRAMLAAGVTPPDPLPPLSAPTTSGR